MQSENEYVLTTRLLSVPENKMLVIEISNYCDLANIIIDIDDYRLVNESKLKNAVRLLHENKYKKVVLQHNS